LTDHVKLPVVAKAMILAQENEILISAATIQEIAIKFARNKGLPDDMPFSATVALALFENAGYALLAITARHASQIDFLPLHHKDPFDRILVAQSICESCPLVTVDRTLSRYGQSIQFVG
jgi:PIN domain nuclease of toxin-antitoxin system